MADEVEVKQEAPKTYLDIAAEARAEYDAEKSDKEPAKEETPPPEKAQEEPKAEPQEPVKEDKPQEAPVEEKKQEAEVPKTESPDDEKQIQEYAIKHGMTLLEAREDIEKTKAVVSKYKSPEELARALRLQQSAYDKLKNEASKVEEKDPYQISDNPRLEVYQFVHANRDKLVEQFRQTYPAKSRDMEDDAVLEDVSERLLSEYSNFQRTQHTKLQSDASVRREQLLSSLNENDRRFLPDVKAVLDKTTDRAIVSKNFSLNDIVYWAKGQAFDRAVKEAEERGFKRAQEQSKIVGVMPSAPKGTTSPAKKTVSLSAYEKKRAEDMFRTTTMTDEEKYEAFIEVTKKRK